MKLHRPHTGNPLRSMKFSKLEHFLERIFSPQIFKENLWLRVVYYALTLHSILLFSAWRDTGVLTTQSLQSNGFSCWPYFLSCDVFYVFSDMPSSYSLGILYTILGTGIALSCIYAIRDRWALALFFLFLITCFKIFVVYIASYSLPTNYNELVILISILLLFARERIFALKICSTLFYYAAFFNKLHSGYLSGDVFTSLALGLPFVPDTVLPYFGILFMIMLLILPTLLWSQSRRVRILAAICLMVFHLSTIAIVGFMYPLLCIPLILLTIHSPQKIFSLKTISTDRLLFLIVLLMIVGQLFSLMIPGDNRLTGEGTKFGFYMHDANHQCSGFLEQKKTDRAVQLFPYSNGMAMGVCDPYRLWFTSRSLCAHTDTESVSMYFKHSMNGGRFYELVNEENICSKSYSLIQHNEWIHTNRPLPEWPPKNSFLISNTLP